MLISPRTFIRSVSVILIWASIASAEVNNGTLRISEGKSAWTVWTEMTRSSLTYEPIEFQVSPTAGAVSFGGEKEGGDALITRIMSPTAKDFKMILGSLTPVGLREFYVSFLNGLSNGRFHMEKAVVNAKGEIVSSPSLPSVQNYERMDYSELARIFDEWLSQTHDRPFAFLKQKVRTALFDGDFAGMVGRDWIDRAMRVYPRVYDEARSSDPAPTHFNNWKPIFGEPEKYIGRMVTELLGDWELNFKPQTTYGEFEKMMRWFRDALADEEGRYNSFGHQWLVLPKREIADAEMKKLVGKKIGELYKSVQALITLRGIEMQSGILTSMYNEVRSDEYMRGHSGTRSVLRSIDNLFSSNTGAPALNLEQRSGTAFDPTRRLVQQAIISRYYANDWSGLKDSADYTLIPTNPEEITANLETRFNVTRFEATRALEMMGAVHFDGDEETVHGLRTNSLAPFWNWDSVPYLSPTKKELVKRVTREFIKELAALPATPSLDRTERILTSFARWSAIADIDTDIEAYLKPAPILVEHGRFGAFRSPSQTQRVDVNQQEFGIEFTTRFPLRASSKFTEELTKMGKKAFLQVEYDLTAAEKREIIKDFAVRLGAKLNGHAVEPVQVDGAGHGHKINIAYEIPHPTGGTWRVEWDGIGRDYDPNGQVIPGSERGGVIEIVTPKFKPTAKDVRALYAVMGDVGVRPSFFSGGGHVNFDLAAFAGRPKALARFIALFLQSRDVLTAMFQHPGRFGTAEPHAVDQSFVNGLLSFNGTDEDLKRYLYDGGFYNRRLGRKTKYVQMEMSSYFQDVIPAEYVTKDFDIKNDVWHKQFRVNPSIRKGEFRFFGAPRTEEEAHLQQKLVRALMDKAINDDSPLTDALAPVDVEKMVADPKALFDRFDKVMGNLHLPAEEYEGFFAEGLQNVRYYVESSFYQPYESKMKLFPVQSGWKASVAARSAQEGMNSKEFIWDSTLAEAEALALYRTRMATTRQAYEARNRQYGGQALPQRWREYSEGTVAQLKTLPWDRLKAYPEAALEYAYERFAAGDNWAEARTKIQAMAANTPEFDSMVATMIAEPRNELDLRRLTFYTLMMKDSKAAAYGVSQILMKANATELAFFYKQLSGAPFEFAAGLGASIEIRRAMYRKPGVEFETGWGDLVKHVIELAKAPVQKKLLKERFTELFKTEEVSMGDLEWAEIMAFGRAVRGVQSESLGSLVRRRCNRLLIAF